MLALKRTLACLALAGSTLLPAHARAALTTAAATVTVTVLTTAAAASVTATVTATVTAIDDQGARVTLERPAQRIVALSPGITELLFAIGAGARVVGASDFSDYPEAARVLPRVARAQGIDLERIAQLHPDLIVTWGSGYPPALLDALRGLGVAVLVYEPRTLESIASAMERLGTLTGAREAPAAADAFRVRLAALRARYSARPPVRVFYQVWGQPVMTLTGHHLSNAVIEACGGRNVFTDLAPLVATVDIESVLARRPELIFAAEPGGVDHGALEFWKHYPRLPAVAGAHLLTLDADTLDRGAVRILDATAQLCTAIESVRATPP